MPPVAVAATGKVEMHELDAACWASQQAGRVEGNWHLAPAYGSYLQLALVSTAVAGQTVEPRHCSLWA